MTELQFWHMTHLLISFIITLTTKFHVRSICPACNLHTVTHLMSCSFKRHAGTSQVHFQAHREPIYPHLAPLFVLSYLAVDDILTFVRSHDIHTKQEFYSAFCFTLYHSQFPFSYMCTMQTVQYTVLVVQSDELYKVNSIVDVCIQPTYTAFPAWHMICKSP